MKRLIIKANSDARTYAENIKGMKDIIENVCDDYVDKGSEDIIRNYCSNCGISLYQCNSSECKEAIYEDVIAEPRYIIEDIIKEAVNKLDQGFVAVKDEVETILNNDKAFIEQLANICSDGPVYSKI